MDFQFIIYVFLAIVIITYTPLYFYRQNKYVGALTALIIAILIMTFYGIRWFTGENINAAGPSTYSGTWPPYINVCPDYLTYYEGTVGKGCINKTEQKIGNLDVASETPTTAQLFNHLATGSTPVYTAYNLDNKEAACMKARELGLTWEGITNGDVCTF